MSNIAQAKDYAAKLEETRDNISIITETLCRNDELREYSDSIDLITKEVKDKKNSTADNKINVSETYLRGLSDPLDKVYRSARYKIEGVNERLVEEWDVFYRMGKTQEYVKKLLESKDLNNNREAVKEISKEVILLLDLVDSISISDYDDELALLERTYDVIYEMMKLELALTTDDTIFNRVKLSESDTFFISKRIKKDLENIDDNSIKLLQLELQKQGLNRAFLLNKKLITSIALNKYSDFVDLKRSDFIELVKDFDESIEWSSAFEENRVSAIKSKYYLENEINEDRIKIIKGIGIIAVNTFLLFPAYNILSKIGVEKTYFTTRTIYDLSTGEASPSQYYSNVFEDTLMIEEISEWSKPGFLYGDEYERTVTFYVLDDLAVSKFKKMKDVNLFVEELDDNDVLRRNTKRENTEVMPNDYSEGEKRFVISEIKDHENYKANKSKWSYWLYGGYLLVDALGMSLFFKKKGTISSLIKERKSDRKLIEARISDIDYNQETRDKYNEKALLLADKVESVYESLPNSMIDEEVYDGYQKVKKSFNND